eukprot:gene10258-12582_t
MCGNLSLPHPIETSTQNQESSVDNFVKFTEFIYQFKKNYSTPEEIEKRFKQFSETLDFINEFNRRADQTMEVGLNEFSDWSLEEKKSLGVGSFKNNDLGSDFGNDFSLNSPTCETLSEEENCKNIHNQRNLFDSPSYIDWRDRAVSGVRSQGSCESSYAFSAVALFESALMRKGIGETDLSEQEIIDCTFNKYQFGLNKGCDGGDPAVSIRYAIQNGLSDESSYPYTSGISSTQGTCKVTEKRRFPNLSIYSVPPGNENALAKALQKGPVAVTLNGENHEFYNYKGGIYNNGACSTRINHAVLLVGMGVRNGQEYWIIKNSWGPSW